MILHWREAMAWGRHRLWLSLPERTLRRMTAEEFESAAASEAALFGWIP